MNHHTHLMSSYIRVGCRCGCGYGYGCGHDGVSIYEAAPTRSEEGGRGNLSYYYYDEYIGTGISKNTGPRAIYLSAYLSVCLFAVRVCFWSGEEHRGVFTKNSKSITVVSVCAEIVCCRVGRAVFRAGQNLNWNVLL